MIHTSPSTPARACTGKQTANARSEPIVRDESATSATAARSAWLQKLLVSMSALAFVYVSEE